MHYRLRFATKSSPGHQRNDMYQNSPQNGLSKSKNPQVQTKPSFKLWFATKWSPRHQHVKVHRNTPQKRAQQVKKASMYTQICATGYDWRRNRHLSIKVSMCIKIVPKDVLSGSKNPQVQSKPSYKTMVCDEIVSWASACRGTPKQSPKTCT